MNIAKASLSIVFLCALVAATPNVMTDYSVVVGSPVKLVVLHGAYVDAINIAYADWRNRKAHPPILSQNVSVSPEPGTHLLYVRFFPGHVPYGMIEDGDVFYVIDPQKRKIVRRSSYAP